MKNIVVTGAAGFIGSTFVRQCLQNEMNVVVIDAFTYAGHEQNLTEVMSSPNFKLVRGDICDRELVRNCLRDSQADALVNFAAESHVDNSIEGPAEFIQTNIVGTFSLLEEARKYYSDLSDKQKFRFLHVSTDEVFGELGETGYFTETSAYSPNSPYSASKASSDHLVRAWFHTYGLPCVITNCSNNYGPRQFPEKLIPRMIQCALNGETLPVYGKGTNVRDWIHVEDHCRGIMLALKIGELGGCYCFGGRSERKNIDVVESICKILDEKRPLDNSRSYQQQIGFVEDRLGHDFRYAIDDSYAEKTLGFKRKYENFEQGLDQTIDWYLDNSEWTEQVMRKSK